MSNIDNVELSNLIICCQSGFACGKKDDNGIAQIRMNNITTSGELNLSTIRHIPKNYSKNFRNYILEENDILFNSTNSPNLVGKTALFHLQNEEFVFSNHFLRIKTNQKVLDSNYLSRWLITQV